MAKKTRARHAALLKKGSYYWAVLRRVAEVETCSACESNPQYCFRDVCPLRREGHEILPGWHPVLFTGADASGRNTWDYIGYASADGHCHIEVHRKGPKITGAPK